MFRKTFHYYIREIAKYVEFTGKTVLDVACAMGGFVSLCRRYSAFAFGVDISQYALMEARKTSGAQYVQADVASNLPFGSDSVNILTAFDLIEHIEEPNQLIAEFQRVLKPQGWLFISTPNPMSFKRLFVGTAWNYDETHVRFYAVRTLIKLLNQYNFDVIQVTFFTESRFEWAEVILKVLSVFKLSDYLFLAARRK